MSNLIAALTSSSSIGANTTSEPSASYRGDGSGHDGHADRQTRADERDLEPRGGRGTIGVMDPFDLDPLPRLRMEGRRFVAREGQSEFLHPDHYSERTPEHQEPIPDAASARATRVLAVKLIAMAMVMLGLLAGVIVIFT